MRNSLLPLVLVVLCGLAAVSLIPQGSPQGVNGPPIFPGIFRLPKQERFRVHPAALDATNVVTGAPAVAVANPPESWRSVMVAGDDDHAATRAVMYALAERLTEHGCLVVLDPPDAPPYGVGVERLVRVATRSASLPTALGGPCSARVAVTTRLMRFSADHIAACRLPAFTGPETLAVEIEHRSQAKAGSMVTWPTWYAAVGWGIAGAAIDAFAPSGLPPVVDAVTRRSLPSLRPLADWKLTLPQPPQSQGLRWDGAMQEELVRGWIGSVHGLETIDAKNARVPTIDLLLDRLKKGSWGKCAESTPTVPVPVYPRLFVREGDRGLEWFSIMPQDALRGWDVVWWQERPGTVALHQQWLAAAKAGDVQALMRLAAYRACGVIPADQRAAAQALLDEKP